MVSINMYKERRFLMPEGFLFRRQRFNEILLPGRQNKPDQTGEGGGR